MLKNLSERLQGIFSGLRSKGRLTENDINDAMREIRLALLEADVSYKVVKNFVATVTKRALRSDMLDSLTPCPAGHQDRQRRADKAHGRRHRPAAPWPTAVPPL